MTCLGQIVYSGQLYVPKEYCEGIVAEKNAEILRLLDAAEGVALSPSCSDARKKLLSTTASVKGELRKEMI